ncbi:MAG: hypothetical protein OES13_00395 [Acidimicrobiia bacterium]|nr:hypothetical protein [Acidimicrobiia bacterium]
MSPINLNIVDDRLRRLERLIIGDTPSGGAMFSTGETIESRLSDAEAALTALDARVTALEAGGTPDLLPYMVYDSTGNTVITGTPVQLILDAVRHASFAYSLASNEVEVLNAGVYVFMASATYTITDTAGGTRGSMQVNIETDEGLGFLPFAPAYGSSYHRETAGASTSTCFLVRELNATDKVRVMLDRTTATTNIDTVVDQSSLTIFRAA